jgi:membrane-bound lytic murein transglycosylase D
MPAKLLLISSILFLAATPSFAATEIHPDVSVVDTANNQEQVTNAAGIVLEFEPLMQFEEEDIWQRIKDGFQLAETSSPLTQKHETWYASRPDYIQRMVARSERYLYFIIEEVEKRNMPSELALLPMIESGFNPQALSRSRAAGIWQFMPVTGKHFGLEQNWWSDHRKNVTAATYAALDYLQKLHMMFGSWDLALAAYNAGEGTVRRAMEKNRAQGLPTDYANLPLSDETRNYVPKLQAMKNLINDPEHYGLTIESIPNEPYFTKVSAPQQIDTELAANLAGIPHEELIALNPEHNRPVITAKAGNSHEILLPVEAADIFLSNLSSYEQPLVTWQTYHAKRGEKVDKIAQKFGISTAEFRNVNSLSSSKALPENRLVLVPAKHTSQDQPSALNKKAFELLNASHHPELKTKQVIRHEVGENETLYAIALRYGVTIKQIMQSNQLKTSRLKVGQVLVIPAGGRTLIQKQAANKNQTLIALANP